VGAILTQNTAWPNVEKAIANLKRAGLLDAEKIAYLPKKKLAKLIRPAGYFNVKAQRLQNLCRFLLSRGDTSLASFRKRRLASLRKELLGVNGVGAETADSILLYAFNKPTFVVDAYTRRILRRHGFISKGTTDEEVKHIFEENLPKSAKLYNEFHALFVALGKDHCRPRQRCQGCPLKRDLFFFRK